MRKDETAMKTRFQRAMLAAVAVLALSTPAVAAGGDHIEIERQNWSFSGIRGQFDKAQLQRGFQVYEKVCAQCHGLSRVYFRNLVQPGGPEFPEAAIKGLAAEWPNQITDGPNDDGEMFKRPAKLPDPILGPYANEKAARAANNGAYPPDLSLIAKARNPERQSSWYVQPFLMLGDIFSGYQEGGPDYLYALLTGYTDPPANFHLGDGMNYNKAFPGHQIAMPAILGDDAVTYEDGTPATRAQHARDVASFLAWAADPSHDQRKRLGWQVIFYLLITSVLLYLGKKRIWASLKH